MISGTPQGWPYIYCKLEDWQQIMAYVARCEVEINGFGLADYVPERHELWIHSPFILEQQASMHGVDTKPAAWEKYMAEQVQAGAHTERICFQWHSHVWGPVVFSQVDTDNMARWPGDMLISLVLNKVGHYTCRLDLYRPFKASVELPVNINLPGPSQEQLHMARDQIKALVDKPIFTPRATNAPRGKGARDPHGEIFPGVPPVQRSCGIRGPEGVEVPSPTWRRWFRRE